MLSGHHASCLKVALTVVFLVVIVLHPELSPGCPDLIGEVPFGPCQAVARSGDYAYFSSGPVLMIADVSDPTAPIVLGELELPADIQDIEESNGYAHLACGFQGYWIVDVTDPTAPVVAGSYALSLWPVGLALSGDLVFIANVASQESLVILDVSDPASIIRLGSISGLVSVSDVMVAGGYAYLVGYGDGLKVVDVADPSQPELIGESDPNPSVGVFVQGDYVYTVDLEWSPDVGLRVFDVSDPAHPTQVGFVEHPGLMDVWVAGSLAYVSAGYYLKVFDVVDPTSPVLIGSLEADAMKLSMAGQYVYASAFEHGLRVFDVVDPTLPIEVSAVETPGYTKSIAAAGPLVFADGGDEGVRVFDATNPTSPIEIATTGGPNGAWDLAVSGSFLYVATGSRFEVFDIAEPSSPVKISSLNNHAMGIAVKGDYAYVAASPYSSGSLIVIDISNPHSPVTLGSAALPEGARTVAVEAGHAYVTTLNDGLRVVDVSVPADPVVVGHFSASGVTDVAVEHGSAFVCSSGGLRIVDVTNPALPVQVGLYSEGSSAESVGVSGRYAYVGVDGWASAGVHVIDISDPSEPFLVGLLGPADKAGMAEQIRVVGDRVYTAHSTGGWSITLGCHALFVDGFESGDTRNWSSVSP